MQKIFEHRYVYILLTKEDERQYYVLPFPFSYLPFTRKTLINSRLPCTPLDLSETRSQRITVIIESRWWKIELIQPLLPLLQAEDSL